MTELASELVSAPEDRLAQAEAMVRAWCGWHIAPERDEVLTLDGPGGAHLTLPSLHVVDVASVVENGELLDPANGLYTWSAAGIITKTGTPTGGPSRPAAPGWPAAGPPSTAGSWSS